MQAGKGTARIAVAPLLLVLVLGTAACGGGGGGAATTASGTGSTANVAAADGGGASASGGGGQDGTSASGAAGAGAEVRYSLAAVGTANTTTAGFQTLAGVAATPSGYRVVWSTAAFDAAGAVQRTWFEQRYDDAGQRLGGETVVDGPGDAALAQTIGTVDGGTLAFTTDGQMRPSLLVQQRSAAGTATDAPIALGGAAHSWAAGGLRLANGSVAVAFQPSSSVGPAEISTGVLVPGPR